MPHMVTANRYVNTLRKRAAHAPQNGVPVEIGKYQVTLHEDESDPTTVWIEVRKPGSVQFVLFPLDNDRVWSKGKLQNEMRKHARNRASRKPPQPSKRKPWCLVLAGKVAASYEFLAWLAEYCPADLKDLQKARKQMMSFRLKLDQTGWTSEAITEFAHEAKEWKPTLELSYLDTETGEVWEYDPED